MGLSFYLIPTSLLLDEKIEMKATLLRRSGAFKLPDAIVAATAIVNDLRLLTLDKRMTQASIEKNK